MLNAFLFADYALGVGLGHKTRMLSLQAELTKLGFNAVLLDTKDLNSTLQTSKYCDLIAIDSYILELESYILASNIAKICLFFDDTMRLNYPKGVIVNNAYSANFNAYFTKYPKHILFLGSNFRLLQPAFLESLEKNCKQPIALKKEISKILITLGGDDILGLNAPLSKALLEYFNLEIHCISKIPLENITTHYNLNAKEMVNLITQMDLCICACGQSLCEILACGIPTIALEIANNQHANLQSFIHCVLPLEKTYLLPKDTIIQNIFSALIRYKDLNLRKMHQKNALEILNAPTKWKENLQKLLLF